VRDSAVEYIVEAPFSSKIQLASSILADWGAFGSQQ